ncbi:MAG TPA: glycosyltransferase family 4 protein [Kiritimatiellia bacterium]|nr:glycosyltransferase family 4 protein [Kiritimatiellia bacterium]HRZ10931.1 glycosyltransferase family 4 protein [Kiritimatiellia bacterium]HSA18796.1 glycosyltransferase family 4 protein [Kiritimatiellia bacterium]
MRLLTNMAFWQCPYWTERVDCLYDLAGAKADPAFMPFWKEAWRLFRKSRAYDAVLTMESRTSLAYGWLCSVAGRPSKQIMTEVFIDQPRPASLFWRLKTALFRWIARRGVGALVLSSAELETVSERFGLPRKKLRFIPLQCTIEQPREAPADEGFVLSAGRSLRDYGTVIRAAAGIRAPVLILCGPADDIPAGPASVTVEREATRERYMDALARCSVVALALQDTLRPTGQVVMLEAMGLGKPVVVTRHAGTVDYIRDGENGFLVEPGDAEGLARKVRMLLDDPALRRRIGRQALADVMEKYSLEAHAKARLQAISELLSAASSETT